MKSRNWKFLAALVFLILGLSTSIVLWRRSNSLNNPKDPESPTNPPTNPPYDPPDPRIPTVIERKDIIDSLGNKIGSDYNLFVRFPLLRTRVNEKIPDDKWDRIHKNLWLKWQQAYLDLELVDIEIKKFREEEKYKEVSVVRNDLDLKEWIDLKAAFPLIRRDPLTNDIDSVFTRKRWNVLLELIKFVQYENLISHEIELVEVKEYKFVEDSSDSEKYRYVHNEASKRKDWWETIKRDFSKIIEDKWASFINEEFEINPEGRIDIKFAEWKLRSTKEIFKIVIEDLNFSDHKWKRFELDTSKYPELKLHLDSRDKVSFSYSEGSIFNGKKYDFSTFSWTEFKKWKKFIRDNMDSSGNLNLNRILILTQSGIGTQYIAIRELVT